MRELTVLKVVRYFTLGLAAAQAGRLVFRQDFRATSGAWKSFLQQQVTVCFRVGHLHAFFETISASEKPQNCKTTAAY